MSSKITKDFCPAPWMSMFYRANSAQICCANGKLIPSSPFEFRTGAFVQSVKNDFLNGHRPATCKSCWELEDNGFISVRKSTYDPLISPMDHILFNETTERNLEYLELRSNNLCNFSCRMCSPIDSNQIGQEVRINPKLKKYYTYNPPHNLLEEINDSNFQQIINQISQVKFLSLTGGEPMLIKQYYDLLDYIVENNYSKNITLQITTNCSVYNSHIVERLKEFKEVLFTLSLDGVEETAEYQRYGTVWSTVKENSLKFLELPNINPVVNATLTAYSILDLSRFADFLIELYNKNNSTYFMLRPAIVPNEIQYTLLNKDLSKRAIDEIEKTIKKISDNKNFELFVNELHLYLNVLLHSTTTEYNFKKFQDFTKDFDEIRNQSFEKTFGYKLY